MKKLLVTGAAGLIGSEVVTHFSNLGWEVVGIDNNIAGRLFWQRRGYFVEYQTTSRDTRKLRASQY